MTLGMRIVLQHLRVGEGCMVLSGCQQERPDNTGHNKIILVRQNKKLNGDSTKNILSATGNPPFMQHWIDTQMDFPMAHSALYVFGELPLLSHVLVAFILYSKQNYISPPDMLSLSQR